MKTPEKRPPASDADITPALDVMRLTKTFGIGKGAVQAVRGVDFEVAPGQVFGFLGPNGAGKSTTIRMIMDLVRPTSGRIRIFGQEVTRQRGALHGVGALVEGALFYEHLTGRRNLEVLARTRGHHDSRDIDALLERLGMADRADRPVQGYSMGMKQRLGVAAALLGGPKLVILDEPTNGLDPAGIRQMRGFIRRLVDEDGLTVFLSSHLLAEIEQVCDRVAIIHRGRIIRQGRVAELLADQERLRLEVSNGRRAVEVLGEDWPCQPAVNRGDLHLAAAGGDQGPRGGTEILHLEASREATPEVIRRLFEARIDLFEAHRERRSLEDFFMEATEGPEPGGDCHA